MRNEDIKPRMTLLIAASALPLALALPVVSGALASTPPAIAQIEASAAPAASAPLGNLVLASHYVVLASHEDPDGEVGRCGPPPGSRSDHRRHR